MDKGLKTIEKYILFITALASPLLVAPVFPDFYNTPKLVFLATAISLLILIKAAQIIASQKLEINISSFDLPVLLIAVSYLASAIIKSPNKTEAFFLPGTATLIVAASLFYFFVNQNDAGKKFVSSGLIISGFVASVVSLISISGINQKMSFLPEFARTENFSLVGGNLLTFIFLATLVPLAIDLIIKDKKVIKKVFWGLSLLLITASIASNLYQILPGKKFSPKLPPVKISWEIGIDAIKDSPILGAGAGNYLTAFNRFRPLSYNTLDFWQSKFNSSQNFFLHTITETGLLGLFAIVILAIAIIKALTPSKTKQETALGDEIELDFLKIGLGISVLALFFSGPHPAPLLVFFTYLALNAKTKKITFSFEAVQKEQRQTSIMASALVSLPLIVGVLVFLYFGSKIVSAEYTFKKGLDAVSQNKGQDAFNLISAAINKNPKVDRYHATLAQISFLAAQSLTNGKQQDQITDNDKTLISNLIQQAISEGKAAVSLNPQKADNWELLGNLYKQIMAFAQGSDQFAIQALSQAVALDPVNSLARISLGGVYFAIGDYESAIDVFKLAVAAKPDYANARYNLAVAYREKGELDKALAEMKNTLSFLEEGSNDRKIVEEEIKNIESKKKEKEAKEAKSQTQAKELTPPTKPTSALEPKVNLPEEAAPPSPVATPEGSQAPAPSSTPVPSPTTEAPVMP